MIVTKELIQVEAASLARLMLTEGKKPPVVATQALIEDEARSLAQLMTSELKEANTIVARELQHG